jgi:hypothetical protein
MGKHTWEGWQISVSGAPHPTSILYGANLRQSLKDNSPEPPQPEPTQGEFLSQMPSSLELEAAAMRVKLQQNRKALEELGIQSVSDKIKQFNEQQK